VSHPSARSLLSGAIACARLVLLAVLLEVLGGAAANSSVPTGAEDVLPISWPQPIPVLWWFVVAAAALGYRLFMHRLAIRSDA
jgi:hypothetical protein